MRILKMIAAIIIGITLVIWIFVTFIAKEHHVHITKNNTGSIQYKVDDGKTFNDARACVKHCLNRQSQKWYFRNIVSISADVNVDTNDIQYIGDFMCFNHIYPRSSCEIEDGKSYDYQPRLSRDGFSIENN